MAIAAMVEKRDPYTSGHQARVAELARAIGRELNLPPGPPRGLYIASAIHDIGKISLPAEILSKPSQLNNLEKSLIQAHAQAGYDILRMVDFPWPVATIVLQHHERLNGTGYPQGLAGDDHPAGGAHRRRRGRGRDHVLAPPVPAVDRPREGARGDHHAQGGSLRPRRGRRLPQAHPREALRVHRSGFRLNPGGHFTILPTRFDRTPGWRNLVDARDLKSLGTMSRAGSIPALGTIIKTMDLADILLSHRCLFLPLKNQFCPHSVPTLPSLLTAVVFG